MDHIARVNELNDCGSKNIGIPTLQNFGLCHCGKRRSIYIFGGNSFQLSDEKTHGTLYQFDLSTLKFRKVEKGSDDLVGKRSGHGLVYRSRNDSLIVFGGTVSPSRKSTAKISNNTIEPPPSHCNRMFEFRFEDEKWTEFVDIGKRPPRMANFSVLYNDPCDVMLVFGGSKYKMSVNGREVNSEEDFCEYSNALYGFDFGRNRWVEVKSKNGTAPYPREDCTIDFTRPSLQHEFIMFGGSQYEKNLCFNDAWLFRLKDKSWSLINSKGKGPSERFGHGSVVCKDNLYVFGGSTFRGNRNGQKSMHLLNDLFVLNLSNNFWNEVNIFSGITIPKMTSHRLGMVTSNCFVLLGGYIHENKDIKKCNRTFTFEISSYFQKNLENIENNTVSSEERSIDLTKYEEDESNRLNALLEKKNIDFFTINCKGQSFRIIKCLINNNNAMTSKNLDIKFNHLKEDVILRTLLGKSVGVGVTGGSKNVFFELYVLFREFKLKEHMLLILKKVERIEKVDELIGLFYESFKTFEKKKEEDFSLETASIVHNNVRFPEFESAFSLKLYLMLRERRNALRDNNMLLRMLEWARLLVPWNHDFESNEIPSVQNHPELEGLNCEREINLHELSRKAFSNLFSTMRFSNIVLRSGDGKDFKAHYEILFIKSTFFHQKLSKLAISNSKPVVVFVKELGKKELLELLRFIYQKRTLFDRNNLNVLFNLIKFCESYKEVEFYNYLIHGFTLYFRNIKDFGETEIYKLSPIFSKLKTYTQDYFVKIWERDCNIREKVARKFIQYSSEQYNVEQKLQEGWKAKYQKLEAAETVQKQFDEDIEVKKKKILGLEENLSRLQKRKRLESKKEEENILPPLKKRKLNVNSSSVASSSNKDENFLKPEMLLLNLKHGKSKLGSRKSSSLSIIKPPPPISSKKMESERYILPSLEKQKLLSQVALKPKNEQQPKIVRSNHSTFPPPNSIPPPNTLPPPQNYPQNYGGVLRYPMGFFSSGPEQKTYILPQSRFDK